MLLRLTIGAVTSEVCLMKNSYGNIFAIAFALISNGTLALDANEEITSSDIGFQYWVYSVTWQPSFCLLKPETAGCAQPPNKFLTYGIWPYNNSTAEKTNRHPAFCNSAPSCEQETECAINEKTLKQITHKPEIIELVTASPEAMFRHEWKKHGTCAGKTETNYFNDIVKLRKVVNYDESMFNSWIGGSVTFEKLRTAFPSNASFRCFVKDGKQYLHEVFYRITPEGEPYQEDAKLQIGIPCLAEETYIPTGS